MRSPPVGADLRGAALRNGSDVEWRSTGDVQPPASALRQTHLYSPRHTTAGVGAAPCGRPLQDATEAGVATTSPTPDRCPRPSDARRNDPVSNVWRGVAEGRAETAQSAQS